MKVLLINGSPNEHGCTYTALAEVADTLHKYDIATEIVYLGRKPIAGCIACMKCFETGHCFRDDMVKELQKRLDEFDGIVLGSPVYYSNPTGQILSFVQRLFFCKEGVMAGKLGASVVSCRRGGASAAFESLNQFFTIAICQWYHHNTGILCMGSLPKMYTRTKRACRLCAPSVKIWHGCSRH